MQLCRIQMDQPYIKVLTEQQRSGLLNLTCLHPQDRRERTKVVSPQIVHPWQCCFIRSCILVLSRNNVTFFVLSSKVNTKRVNQYTCVYVFQIGGQLRDSTAKDAAEFGIQINTLMTEVPGRVLPPPKVPVIIYLSIIYF